MTDRLLPALLGLLLLFSGCGGSSPDQSKSTGNHFDTVDNTAELTLIEAAEAGKLEVVEKLLGSGAEQLFNHLQLTRFGGLDQGQFSCIVNGVEVVTGRFRLVWRTTAATAEQQQQAKQGGEESIGHRCSFVTGQHRIRPAECWGCRSPGRAMCAWSSFRPGWSLCPPPCSRSSMSSA